MKCPFCSQDNLVGAQFCDNCGADLKQSSKPQTYTPAARLEPAPPPTPIFPTRNTAAPVMPAPAPAASPVAPAPAYTATPAAPALAYVAAPAAPAPQFVAAPTHTVAPASAAPVQVAAVGYASLTDIHSGQVFLLNSDRVMLGRGPSQLGDGVKLSFEGVRGGATVSKRHALVRRDSTGIFIEDVGSGNGTFINGEKLPRGIERGLTSGDQLRLGAVVLTFGISKDKK